MKHLIIWAINITFTIWLYADIMIDQLINKTHNIGWYMFETKDNNTTRYYLASQRYEEGNNKKVWNFTKERKWKPVHNAEAFDSFVAASKNFDDIKINNLGTKITFGKITNTKNISLLTNLKDLENKEHSIKWYYWMTTNGYAFLATGLGSKAGIRIYQHMVGGKWRPIHNANTFDGYPAAQSVFSKVAMSDDAKTITIEYKKFNIPTLDNELPNETLIEDFKMTSDDFVNGATYTDTDSPHLDWTNTPNNAKSLAIEVVSLTDNKAAWRIINIDPGDSNSSYIPKGAGSNYRNMKTLTNDFDFTNTFSTGATTGSFLVLLYAISEANLTSMAEAKKYTIKHTNIVFTR